MSLLISTTVGLHALAEYHAHTILTVTQPDRCYSPFSRVCTSLFCIGLFGADIIKLSLATITIANVPKLSKIIYNCNAFTFTLTA